MTTTEMLRHLLGFVEESSEKTLHIFQDDATKAYHIKAYCGDKVVWSHWGYSLDDAIHKAYITQG